MRREAPLIVEILGSRTVVHRYGRDGDPAILAVHGFRGSHSGLEPLARALSTAGYRVLVPDLPGAGASSPLGGPHDLAGHGRWLLELAGALAPRLLLGHSFGTVVVASAIARGATHAGAVLVNPILRPPLDGPRRIATAAARAYYALAELLPERHAIRLLGSRAIAAAGGRLMTTTRDPALRRWIVREHRRQAGAFASRRAVLEAFRASTTSTVADFAGAFTRPTLVLGGDRDPLSPVAACTPEGSGLSEGDFHVFPERGHLLPYEAPWGSARLIAAWERAGERIVPLAPAAPEPSAPARAMPAPR
ncbi:alpha/beta fold hydrolase [Leucobacter sp. wl10]|uniref:alpha/beta fold hydrolase n=1 Tax=Leucobacter sp. wl10 TaxID=2304677 RepID=UPI0013C3412D|nr:alpha/beta fold hydrolase [Leucobacter sp. wl10]